MKKMFGKALAMAVMMSVVAGGSAYAEEATYAQAAFLVGTYSDGTMKAERAVLAADQLNFYNGNMTAKASYSSTGISIEVGYENEIVIDKERGIYMGGLTIGGVAAGINDTDAVNKGQMDAALANLNNNNTVSGANSTAVGHDNEVTGDKSTAIGYDNEVTGEKSGAFGDPNIISGNGSYSVGNDNNIATDDTFVLGSNVTKTTKGSVILGVDSEATEENVVSVGAVGKERKIVNVAEGDISSATSTDAVNGGQLYTELAKKVDAGTAAGDGVAIGSTSKANGVSVAIGKAAYADGPAALAIGVGAEAINSLDVAIGAGAKAEGSGSVALGDDAHAEGYDSYALGVNAHVSKDSRFAYAIGTNTEATANYANAFGFEAKANGLGSVAIGTNAKALETGAYAIGNAAYASKEDSTAIGYAARAKADQALAIGCFAEAQGENSVAIGRSALALAKDSYAIGYEATANGEGSYAIGNGATANGKNSLALGNDSVADEDNTISVGKSGAERKIVNVAKGEKDTDAVNKKQLDDEETARINADKNLQSQIDTLSSSASAGMSELASKINQTDARVDRVGATAAALAAINYQPMAKGQSQVAIGMGGYNGKKATAIGMAYQISDRVSGSVAGAANGSEHMFNVGFNYLFGQHTAKDIAPMAAGSLSLAEAELKAENSALKNKVADQEARISRLEKIIASLGK